MGNIKSWPLPYLWLLIGFIFLIFSNGLLKIIPIAAWLAPIFLLRFLRTQDKTKGLLIFATVNVIAWIIMLHGILPGIMGYIFAVSYGIIFFLPYLADRLMAPKMKGYLSTLVFPLAWVTMELIATTLSGSWFSLAYTQYGNLPLMQLASITGIWGISFLITWLASVTNWVWEQEFSLSKIWKGVSLYLSILIFILLLGGAYLTFLPADSNTVRTASVTRSLDLKQLDQECNRDFVCIQEILNQSLDDLLEHSKQAADAGAEIIVWQEAGVWVLKTDEAEYIRQVREFAMQENVYLAMGILMIPKDGPRTSRENKVILIDPAGNKLEYLKNHLVPGDNHKLGDGKVLVQDSVYGKLALVICYDADFPNFVRQAGKANVDLMLIPSSDWDTITPLHARMASFRAIENGFSMIRSTGYGLSVATDYHGNVLSQLNDFTTEEVVMIADVPTEGVTTIYSWIGDLFAWLCVLGLLGFIALTIKNR